MISPPIKDKYTFSLYVLKYNSVNIHNISAKYWALSQWLHIQINFQRLFENKNATYYGSGLFGWLNSICRN